MANGKAGRPAKNKEITDTKIKEVEKVVEIKEAVKELPVEKVVETPKKAARKQRDPNELVDVKCIVQGGLNLITSQGLEVVWAEYGDVYPLEFKELIYIMNKYKRFFEEPWIIMEQDVIEDLKATHFYKNIINYEEIDSIFTKTPEQVTEILSKIPSGTKRLIADRASDALRRGTLDSIKVVEILQKELKIDLI